MFDITVYYMNGCVENITPQTLGISYEGSCAAQDDYLDCSDPENNGIVLSRTKIPIYSESNSSTIVDRRTIVSAERMQDAIIVKNGIDTLLFRDRYGKFVRPEFATLFSPVEIMEHTAAAMVTLLGVNALPDAVVEKLIPPDESADDDDEYVQAAVDYMDERDAEKEDGDEGDLMTELLYDIEFDEDDE